ncbi:MAG: hypothetical protein IPK13_08485 [Deltaproteobacteria bacterium]|nr:hypothetical protein [Deltaproteobacteria bacterium]
MLSDDRFQECKRTGYLGRGAQTLNVLRELDRRRLLANDFQSVDIGARGIEAPHRWNGKKLSHVVLVYRSGEQECRATGWLLSIYQNHLELLTPGGAIQAFENRIDNKGNVVFQEIFIRDSRLDAVSGHDALRLLNDSKDRPLAIWFHPEDKNPSSFVLGSCRGLDAPLPKDATLEIQDVSGRRYRVFESVLAELAGRNRLYAAPLDGSRCALPRVMPSDRSNNRETTIGAKRPTISAATPEETEITHRRITHRLYNWAIQEPIIPWCGLMYQVKLAGVDPDTGHQETQDALLKVRVPGDRKAFGADARGNSFGRTPAEYLAYFVARKLGLRDAIPPVAYRTHLEVQLPNGFVATEGAVIHLVPELKTQPIPPVGTGSDYLVLNRMLKNPDGNAYNLGRGIHWVTGQPSDVWFDFSAAWSRMYRGAGVPRIEDLRSLRRSVYESLSRLAPQDLAHLIPLFMSEQEASGMIREASDIVRHIDRLVDEAETRGETPDTLITPD